MAQKNKALEKEIRAKIKELNKQTGAKLSYTKLYEDIESALQPHLELGRDDELIGIYTEGIRALSDKMLERRSLMVSNPVLREKYKGDPAEKYTITMASTQMNDLMVKMMKLQDPDFAESFVWSEKQLNIIRDYEQGGIKDRSLYNEWPKCLKEWDHRCFRKDIEIIDQTFNSVELSNEPYKYDKTRGNEKDVKVAELFYKAKLIKDEIDGYGFFTSLFNRIFNFRKMNAYSDFLAKANETLAKVGFDPKRHESSANRLLYSKIMPPHEQDVKQVDFARDQRTLDNEKKVLDKQNEAIVQSNNEVTEQQALDVQARLIEESKDYINQVIEEYNREHGTDLKSDVKLDNSKSEAINNKATALIDKAAALNNIADKNNTKENPAPKKEEAVDKKVNEVDKKEIPVENGADKKPSDENAKNLQDDITKQRPDKNRIEVPKEDVDEVFAGEVPEIKVDVPKKGFFKKYFG